MSVDYDDMRHSCDVDKDGRPVSNDVAVAVSELRDHVAARMVLCAWHETGRIQFFAENSNLPGDVVRTARDLGYELSHATTRNKHGRTVGYAEFVPTDAGDDVDRGDGPVTDGGVTTYECGECGDVERCDVDDAGQRRCPDCGRAVTAIVTDGGLLTGGGRYHVVCSDCTFEDLKHERHQAARAVDDHRTDEPSHDVRFEEVRGR